ncbi:hypothetical protein niasHT_029544 [Heterodera trifolii]|uniref:Ubiquitin-activating enzyme E1 C-terminal domain-containing protein n=1 Tax=Heterodera trifolii TaxID=157864 RepID=A0ABD2JAZ2_9BILA
MNTHGGRRSRTNAIVLIKLEQYTPTTPSSFAVRRVIDPLPNSYGEQMAAIDTHLYSRQIGLGSGENLILGGVHSVTLHDTKGLTFRDLSAHFYASERDVGKNRAKVCFNKLAERNDNVNCALAVKILSEDFVKQFDMIDWVERKTGLTVSMLTSGVSLLYAFHAPEKVAERKEMDEFCFGFFLIAVLEEVSRGRVPDHRQAIVLEALTKNEENQEVEIPVIKYKFR